MADPQLVSLLVMALKELGHVRGLVVHGSPGMDEISPSAATRVAELRDGEVTEREITPEALGVESQPLEGLGGGSAAENAQVIRDVLSGKRKDEARSATLLNAAAAIYVGERVASLEEGVTAAAASVDSGAAMAKLAALTAETTRSRPS